MFKCAVSFMRDRKTVREDSKHFYSLRDEAREVACHNILEKELGTFKISRCIYFH